ncbi:hypothetical protein ACFLS0_04105 [Candidatus Bipolaricaulota bacterium]
MKGLLATRAGESASLAEDPFAVSAAEHLGEPAAAALLFDVGQCLRFTENPLQALIG